MTGAITLALDWLAERDAPETAIAAHLYGRAQSPDDATRWVRWILDRERDGTWDDALAATVRSLLVLRELRESASLRELDPAIGRALDWVRTLQGAPGGWTDGCSPDRHRRGFCHHFAAGFFSPGAPDVLLGAMELPSGAMTAGESESRFVLSTAALRCTLLWRGGTTDTGLHLEALRRVVAGWEEDRPAGLTTTALLAAVHALLASGARPDAEAAGRALEMIAGSQRGDGSWGDADVFHAMDVFTAARAAGVGGDRARAALDYGARLLVAAQRDDGSWGPEHGPRRALIAVAALSPGPRSPG